MAIISFLITITGATMLLLFAVKMLRNSIERSFGATLRKILTKKANLAGSSLTGVMLAILLQSSAAVALLLPETVNRALGKDCTESETQNQSNNDHCDDSSNPVTNPMLQDEHNVL